MIFFFQISHKNHFNFQIEDGNVIVSNRISKAKYFLI